MQEGCEQQECIPSLELVKIYIGQLPLHTHELQLQQELHSLCDLRQLRIIRGDTHRGPFSLFCYAFATIRASQLEAAKLIRHLQQVRPEWKVNFKFDRPRLGCLEEIWSSEKVEEGEKTCGIMVREVWMKVGVGADGETLMRVMRQYGIVEDIERTGAYCYVKYKQASQATNAYERAQQIAEGLAIQHLQIAFSSPDTRSFIVSNATDFDRQSPSLPILFIAYPPQTTANTQLSALTSICQQYGNIVAHYMRKTTHKRSYFLFTYDCIKAAIKAKVQLRRRKDQLGDRRVEITLLLDENTILRGRDLTHTRRHFAPTTTPIPIPTATLSTAPPTMPIYACQPYYWYNEPSYGAYHAGGYHGYGYAQDLNYYNGYQMDPHEQFINRINTFNNSKDLSEQLLAHMASQHPPPPRPPPAAKDTNQPEKEDAIKLKQQNQLQCQAQKEKTIENQKEQVWQGWISWKHGQRIPITTPRLSLPPHTTINIVSLIQRQDVVSEDSEVAVVSGGEGLLEVGRQLRGRAGVAFSSRFLAYLYWEEGEVRVRVERPHLVKSIMRKLIRLH